MTFWSSQGTLPHPSDVLYTSIPLSISEALVYMGTLTLSCMWGSCTHNITFDFLLPICLLLIWLLGHPKRTKRGKRDFFSLPHMACPLWITIWHIRLNIHLPYNLAILLLGICPKEIKYICTQRLNMNVNIKY